jgi:hypothetical protein
VSAGSLLVRFSVKGARGIFGQCGRTDRGADRRCNVDPLVVEDASTHPI